MKEQDKAAEDVSTVEIGSQPHRAFKVMIAEMFKELGRRLNELSEKLEVLFIIFKNVFIFGSAGVFIAACGRSLVVVQGLCISVASLVAEYRL